LGALALLIFIEIWIPGARATMSRSAVWLIGSWALAATLAGCDSGSFVPPPPPELSTPTEASSEVSAKIVELVLTSSDTPDRRMWAQAVRLDAGLARLGFRLSALAPKDPPARQAELIRDAVARGASALIVEPAEAPEVARALDQVRAAGTPVVLLDRSISVSGQAPPVVEPAPVADSARKLVEAAVADARDAKRLEGARALVVVPRQADVHTGEIRDAFQEALRGAKVSQVETLEFDGTVDGATQGIRARVQADPKIAIVLAATSEGLSGAIDAKEKLGEKPVILVAGYSEMAAHSRDLVFESCAAVADLNVLRLARQAFQAAQALLEGKSVPERTEVPTAFRRYASRPTTPEEYPGPQPTGTPPP
jgi:ABC-type sugar transport system substrate-binding protein